MKHFNKLFAMGVAAILAAAAVVTPALAVTSYTTGTDMAGTYQPADTGDVATEPEIIGLSEELVPESYVILADTGTADVASSGEAVRYSSYGYGNDLGWYTRSISATITDAELFYGVCLNPTLTALKTGAQTQVVSVDDETSEPMTRLRRALYYYHMDTAGGQENILTQMCGTDWHPKYIIMHCVAAMINGDANWSYGASDTLKADAMTYHDWLLTQNDAPENFITYISANTSAGRQAYAFYRLEEEPAPESRQAYLKISKSSTEPETTGDNANYSLAGARYGIFANADDSDPMQILETKEDGTTPLSAAFTFTGESLTVYIRELDAPDGFRLDTTATPVTLTAANTAEAPYTFATDDVPQVLRIIVSKTDSDAKPLEGAVFAIYGPGADGSDVRLGQMTDDGGGNYYFLVYCGTNSPSDYSVVEEAAPEGYEIGNISRYDVGCENEAYITRLFEVILERSPSMDEIRDYNALIQSGMTFAQAAHNVLESDEAADMLSKMTWREAVSMLYRALLDREATEAEIDMWETWDKMTDNTRAFAIALADSVILGSEEFRTTTSIQRYGEFIDTVYMELFGHNADSAGKAGWAGEMFDGLLGTEAVVRMAKSDEFAEIAKGLIAAGDYEGLINRIYRAMLGRNADSAGLADWTAKLEAGADYIDIVDAIAGSAEARAAGAAYMAEIYAENYKGRPNIVFTKQDDSGNVMTCIPFLITDEDTGEAHVVMTGNGTNDNLKAGVVNTYATMTYEKNILDGYVDGRVLDLSEITTEHLDMVTYGEVGVFFGDSVASGTNGAFEYGHTYNMQELYVDFKDASGQRHTNAGRELKEVRFSITQDSVSDDAMHILDLGTITDGSPALLTSALSAITGTKVMERSQEAIIADTVEYDGLTPGLEYTLKGTLMDSKTQEPLKDSNGGDITSSMTFMPESAKGSVTMEFTFDTMELEGTSPVVSEILYYKGVVVASHTDFADEAQTVYIPKIATAAALNGEKQAAADGIVTVTDVVSYKNIVPGLEYTLKGTLMDKVTGDALPDADGGQITAKAVFVPEEESGSVEMTFTFDAYGMAGDMVVFEELALDGVTVAEHKDIEDEGQTITLMEPETAETTAKAEETAAQSAVHTGDDMSLVPYIILPSICGAAIAVIVIVWRVRRSSTRQK